jgi:hypothetical protein
VICELRPSGDVVDLCTDTFAWLRDGESSFLTDLDPELRSLGAVPRPYRDFAAFATGVFLADRTVARPKSWRRPIELEVPAGGPREPSPPPPPLPAAPAPSHCCVWSLTGLKPGDPP